ncbi:MULTISPECIES: right-handed parallel beta-helix repeat-containing protein [unclassified Tolypothrix]|uniref:right-handed parallel beta-helix repeat-containing protein n=1 Tax=unclassified Tolypothrix TaxID=2649714 RepID=UPI0005F78A10|nr:MULTISPECIES: right-handed parallel beta-helix repeat-containing protein [unclassified Tolypothrix]MBE9084994.1 right-handed parallel beta-helix repeat-containing protein [Tolypothrix sp. LEGE 11397]UYD26111.1 right-handed parallel beta-helix repeat-containing protein [Tolypothrix sp. PCC 7712]UYD31650.1 right-handed parallel beta-helix repeat-containing protein [Tolypothrix sp. PCC 7601]BAY92133.1 serine/threonine protein kinase [Microchaete diplosiphon NIES-3275]
MSFCINPQCTNPQNSNDELFCLSCGSELLLQGRYRVVRQLGGGGFAVTFEVMEVRTDTPKVVKVLTNNHQKAIELFQQEAEVLSKLNHPGIPKVERDAYFVYFPRNSQNPSHCFVMEKIVGMDLQKYMENRGMRPIDQNLALQWLRELVTILDRVHKQNFFHRDIKPPNIMLRASSGELALIDFGTARELTQTYYFAQAQGQVTGIISAGYTPLEQMNGQAVLQSDFFALGRTFVYLLTGKQPTDPAIYNSYTNEMGWRSCAPHISPLLADLIDQMMAHLPGHRPANTQEILQRLDQIDQSLQPLPPPLPPPPEWPRRRVLQMLGFGTIGLAIPVGLYTFFTKNKTTLTVSSNGLGDYKTISEAIKNAQPGNQILVNPGFYQESLIIDKPLKIIGDGPVSNIVIESANSNCIVMQTDKAEVRGLTLRGVAGKKNNNFFAVDIPQGQLILAECDITSDSLSCVSVIGATANPIIQQCKIHDSVQAGIFFQKNSRGTVQDCDIFGNGLSGIAIKDHSSAMIQRCKFHDGKQGGVLVYEDGQATVEDCEILGHDLSGIEIRTNGNAVIQRCKINQNKGRGVYVHDGGLGTVENCDLSGNNLGAFYIDTSSKVQRSGNIE